MKIWNLLTGKKTKTEEAEKEPLYLYSVRDPKFLTIRHLERLREHGAYIEMKEGFVWIYMKRSAIV